MSSNSEAAAERMNEASVELTKFIAKQKNEMGEVKAQVRDLETNAARIQPEGAAPQRDRTWLDQYARRAQWSANERTALKRFAGWMKTGNESFLEGLEMPSFQAGLSTDTEPDGGLALPSVVQSLIEKRLRDISPIRQIARVWPTTDAHPRFLVDNNGTTSGWVGEQSARPATEAPNLHAVEPAFGEVYANAPATQWILDDWANAASWLEESIAEEFAVAEGAAFVSGNGITKPRGFTTYPTAATADATRANFTIQHIATGDAAAFIAPSATASPADVLIDTQTALKAGYRQGAVWVMNRATLGTVRKFKDSEGRFAVQRSLEVGAPEMLLGYPVVEAEDMPAIGANAYPIAFGNFQRAYVIVDRSMRMLRDPYTSKPNVLFYGTKRVAGDVIGFDAIKLVKCAAA